LVSAPEWPPVVVGPYSLVAARKAARSSVFPMRRSLSKSERLKKSEEFRRVFGSPLKHGCQGAKLAALRNPMESNSLDKLIPTRLGVTLSKKFGNAVERNHAKRQVREIFRLHKHRIQPGYDLVFLVYPGDFGYQDRERQFLQLVARAGLLGVVPRSVSSVPD
jgi:ribonuclease P protein component